MRGRGDARASPPPFPFARGPPFPNLGLLSASRGVFLGAEPCYYCHYLGQGVSLGSVVSAAREGEGNLSPLFPKITPERCGGTRCPAPGGAGTVPPPAPLPGSNLEFGLPRSCKVSRISQG